MQNQQSEFSGKKTGTEQDKEEQKISCKGNAQENQRKVLKDVPQSQERGVETVIGRCPHPKAVEADQSQADDWPVPLPQKPTLVFVLQ